MNKQKPYSDARKVPSSFQVCEFFEAVSIFYSRNSDRPITPENMSEEEKEVGFIILQGLLFFF